MDIYATVSGFASLTDWGRIRAELDVRIKREILNDFTVSLRVYESYDSRPITEGAPRTTTAAASASAGPSDAAPAGADGAPGRIPADGTKVPFPWPRHMARIQHLDAAATRGPVKKGRTDGEPSR